MCLDWSILNTGDRSTFVPRGGDIKEVMLYMKNIL
jgi:hypothetical protein